MPRRLPALIPACFLLGLFATLEAVAQETPIFGGRDEMAWEYRIREALRRPVTMHFNEAPLHEVLAEVERQIRVPIALDIRALEDAGLDADTPVTVECEQVVARQVLDWMVRSIDLGWWSNHGIVVTTREKHDEHMIVRVYPVADFFVASGTFSQGALLDHLIDSITSTVAPETWDIVGGQGSMRLVPAAGAMAVVQTREVHEEIEHLLYALRAARYAQGMSPHAPEDVFRREQQRMTAQKVRLETQSWAGSHQRDPGAAPPGAVHAWQLPRRHE